MPQQIEVKIAQLRLMLFLLIGSIPAFVIMLSRTFGPNSLNIQKQWGWVLTAVMPTLSLVVGTYAATTHQAQTNKTADLAFYRITVGLGLAYFAIVTLAVVFCELDRDNPMHMLDNISVVIGPLQGLVSAGLGVFFVSHKMKATTKANRTPAEGKK